MPERCHGGAVVLQLDSASYILVLVRVLVVFAHLTVNLGFPHLLASGSESVLVSQMNFRTVSSSYSAEIF